MMDTTTIDPCSLTHARPSFYHLIFLLSYILLESSLPARNGDPRQIHDLSSRKENEWQPQIGGETYPEMKRTSWENASPQTHQAWVDIRQYLLQQSLIDAKVTGKQLRGYLCHLLWWIEQVSAQSLNALCIPKSAVDLSGSLSLPEKGCIVLVCISVSVIATPGGSVSLRAVIDDPYQQIIQEIQSQIREMPIFLNDMSQEELRNAFASLESIFSSQAAKGNTFLAHLRSDWTHKSVLRRETWTAYELSEIHSLSFASGAYTTEHPVPKRAIADRPCRRETSGHRRKRRRRSSSDFAKHNDSSIPLAIEYHQPNSPTYPKG